MRLFLVFLFLPLFSSAQTDLQLLNGLWVKVKAEMKDGSRIVDRKGCGMEFLKYNFSQDGTVNRGEELLFNGSRLLYKKNGDAIMIGGVIFRVIKLTADTMKLSPYDNKSADNQIPVYYFKKMQEHNITTTATYNTILKDSVYEANIELFPQCNGGLGDFMDAIKGKYEAGKLKLSFIVDKKGKILKYTVLEADSISTGFAKNVGSAFSRLGWHPARRNNIPVNSVVTLTLTSGYLTYDGRVMGTLAVEYPFLPTISYNELDRDELEAEQQYYKDAADAFNRQDYEKAVELLGKCVEMDNIDLNAYYLRADAYFKLGKNKDACKDWATLAGLGQVIATKKLAELCKN